MLTIAERYAFAHLNSIIAIFDAMSENDFEFLNIAATAYDFGQISKRDFNKLCKPYGLTATQVMVYMDSVLG